MTRITEFKINSEYSGFVNELKKRIRTAQIKASQNVRNELVLLYFEIGSQILNLQKNAKWGGEFLEKLAKDLQHEFPGMKGFSSVNLSRMRLFAEQYQDVAISSQVVTKLPWGHIITLLFKIKEASRRDWYAEQALENGWSRSILETQIGLNLFDRQGVSEHKVSNFHDRLPPPQSDLAQQSLKDPYVFDFLTIGKDAHEKDIEKNLTNHITKFLLELGTGFAFLGRQVPIQVGESEYFIDMLFYHIKLRCFVVIELKARKFDPKDAGQLNFYLSAVDNKMKAEQDNPTIGILLCQSKEKIVAEYALRNLSSPIGVSEYQLTKMMPKEFKTSLPTIEEIEQELSADLKLKD